MYINTQHNAFYYFLVATKNSFKTLFKQSEDVLRLGLNKINRSKDEIENEVWFLPTLMLNKLRVSYR